MNELLADVSQRYHRELDDASLLLDVLPLIPPTQDTGYLVHLDHGNDNDDDNNGGRNNKNNDKLLLANKLRKLYKLEKQARKEQQPQSHGRTTHNLQLHDKIKISLALALVEVLTLLATDDNLRKSCDEIYDRDIDHRTGCGRDECSKTVHVLQEYLQAVKEIGCKNLSISKRDDGIHCSDLFKMMERCGRLEAEIAKLEQDLNHRRGVLDKEQKSLNVTHEAHTLHLKELKSKAHQIQKEREQQSNMELQKRKEQHESEMNTLQKSLCELQRSLTIATDVHFEEREILSKRLTELKSERESMKTQHELEMSHQKEKVKVEMEYYNAERLELSKLKQDLALFDKNEKEKQREELSIQNVLDMEEKADAILFRSATDLQKLYRGWIQRNIFTKLKKKKGKGGKKGKAKKSKKKK